MLPASTRLGPYEIKGPLGSGGMGEVYRARDTRLDRDVAVKVLPGPFAADPQRVARFEQEARTVASLAHPGIVVLHDVGTANGVPYVVTELLEGHTLRHHLRQAPMPWRRVAEIGIAVADGLAAAHDKGIVHRDLKPENVFLAGDMAPKILDFGIARVTRDATAGDGPGLTQTGAILGTIGYMAPEQVVGDAADARSDLFALGVVLCEAVTGRNPFAQSSLAQTQLAVLHDDPAPLSTDERPVPFVFERLLRRCLEKSPIDRFQTAADLAFALRALLADTDGSGLSTVAPAQRTRSRQYMLAAAALVLATLAAVWSLRDRGADAGRFGSIAVLPLLDRSGDANAQVLGAGVPRAIIRSLLELPGVAVRPFSSVAQYGDGATVDAHEIGVQLGVEAVLTGSIAAHEASPALTVELVDVHGNRSLWLQSYDLHRDILLIQDDILKELAARLGWQLSPTQRERLSRRPTQDTAAYLEYLEGLHAIHQWTVADIKLGIDRLERALARDPDFALAQASLADAYIAAAYVFMQPRVAFEKAREAANAALQRDPLLAEAHAAIATVQFHVDWDWDAADRGFREALRLNPRSAFAHDYYGWYWIARGRPEEAVAELQEAVRLEPRSHLYNVDLGFVLQHAHRFDAAEQQARHALELDSTSSMVPWILSMVYSHRDHDFARAREQAELFLARDRQRPDGYGMLGWVLGMSGEKDAARRMLADLDELSRDIYVRGEARAWVYTGLGDKDAAFRQLQQVCDERSPGIIYLMLDPLLDTLRDDPRFDELLRRIGVAR